MLPHFNFDGKANSRVEFIKKFFLGLLTMFALLLLAAVLSETLFFVSPAIIAIVFTLYLSFLSWKRTKDMGVNGWISLLHVVPYISIAVFLASFIVPTNALL